MSGAVKDELAFRFVSGHRVLDFLATLGNRHRDPVERLREPADLDRWLATAGVSASTRSTGRDLREARQLREALNRVTRALMSDDTPRQADVRELNEWARRPALAPQFGRAATLRWDGDRPVPAALALIAREAIELLTSHDRALIRECAAAPNCSLLYLDRSRAGRRRWCEMETCGSRAKMASFRRRRRATA